MSHFADILRLLERLKADRIVADYAIAGMAANFWDEAVATQDLDVAVVLGGTSAPLDPMRPIFDYLPEADFPRLGEHIEVAGVPVQFLPAWTPLVARSVREAYEGTYDPDDPEAPRLRVMTPTHLVANTRSPFASKARWHGQQRRLSPKEKVAMSCGCSSRRLS